MSKLTELSDTRDEDWAGSHGDITTLVEGSLADRVRVRSGLEGDVTIVERYWNSGYCETCSYEEHSFEVFVGEDEVFSPYEASWAVEGAVGLVSFAQFHKWLNGEENEDE